MHKTLIKSDTTINISLTVVNVSIAMNPLALLVSHFAGKVFDATMD